MLEVAPVGRSRLPFLASVPVGTVYRIVAFVQSLGTAIVLGEYTSVGGDTVNSVATALFFNIPHFILICYLPPLFSVTLGGTGGSQILQSIAFPGGGGGGSDIST